ncbi:TPA: hypothetical protein QDB21_005637 [Burkholderia vietnamiensis]|nr:hypothetical protein [Burkholderia vietnamiensis]
MRNLNPYRAQHLVKRTAIALAVMALSCLLMGCASGTMQTPALVAVESVHPVVRQALMVECPEDLPAASDAMPVTLLKNHVDVAMAYHSCRQRQADLVDAVRSQKGIDVVP